MEAIEELWRAYREWKQLTQREASAIQRSRWSEVHQAQVEKRSLQAEILQLTDRVKPTLNSRIEQEKFDARLREIVNELILLETRNNVTLQSSIAATEERKQDLDTTARRLRQVHNRYVPTRQPAWQNLS